MKTPKSVKAFLKMCLAISNTNRDDLKGIAKLSKDEYFILGNIRAAIQNDLGDSQKLLEKHKLKYNDSNNIDLKVSPEYCKHPANKVIQQHSCGMCTVCNDTLDWYCPSSPDKQCHYYTTKDDHGYFIKLRSGEKHYFVNYKQLNQDNETDDECLFCGEPEERK